jgi:DNA-binding transcriptional ArsR family regulator
MPAGRKRRSPTCQQSLLLLIAGVVVGFPSWIGASHGMGSDDARQFRGCMSSLSWPARWLSFQDSSASCEIAVRAVTSPIASGTAVAVPRPDHAATDQISTHNVVQHRASLMGSPAAALTRLLLRFLIMADAAPNLDRFLHAIADPTRRRILSALKEKGGCSLDKESGLCAFDIEQRVKLAQPTVSHHMQILEKAGVVEAKREGHWRWYRRNEKLIKEMMRGLKGQL